MSSTYSKNRKELSGVKVVPSETVWTRSKSGKPILRSEISIVGKVDMAMPNMVLKANRPKHRTDFIDDVVELPQRAKSELVGHFFNENGERNRRKVAYLIRTDKYSKTKTQVGNPKESRKSASRKRADLPF